MDWLCNRCKLLGKRKDRCLERCECRMEFHYHTNIFFSVCIRKNFFCVGIAKECKHASFNAERWFDYIRNIMLVLILIEICHILS